MPSKEEINDQLELLRKHRQTLAHYLKQQAQLGQAHSPPGITHGIREARDYIQRIKHILREWQIPIEDHPDDTVLEAMPHQPITHAYDRSLGELPADFILVTALEEERDAILSRLPGYHRLPPSESDTRLYYTVDLPTTFSNAMTGSVIQFSRSARDHVWHHHE